jgi:hypothetical protein
MNSVLHLYCPYVWQLKPGHTYDEHLIFVLKIMCDNFLTHNLHCCLGILLFFGKSDVPDWHPGRSNFPGWSFLSHYTGRNFRTGHPLDSSPCDQISQKVLTNLDESAWMVEPKGRTVEVLYPEYRRSPVMT